jgi:hypothetical protein
MQAWMILTLLLMPLLLVTWLLRLTKKNQLRPAPWAAAADNAY